VGTFAVGIQKSSPPSDDIGSATFHRLESLFEHLVGHEVPCFVRTTVGAALGGRKT
jgi:hypothetical protein